MMRNRLRCRRLPEHEHSARSLPWPRRLLAKAPSRRPESPAPRPRRRWWLRSHQSLRPRRPARSSDPKHWPAEGEDVYDAFGGSPPPVGSDALLSLLLACLFFRRVHDDTAATRTILGGGGEVDVVVGIADANRARPCRRWNLLHRLSGLGVDDHQSRRGRRMIILAELRIEIGTAVAAETLAARRYLARRDVEDRHVSTGLRGGPMCAAAAEENGRVGDNLETVRVATVEFVQHELAGFGIGLREKTFRWI